MEAARNATWWELESVTGAEAANEVEMEQRALDADTHTHTHTHTPRGLDYPKGNGKPLEILESRRETW